MSLPKMETKWVGINVGDKKLEIKPWKTKHEKEYLIYKEQAELDDNSIFEILLKPCIKDVEKYNFTPNEEIYIMTKIRSISLGTDITLNFNCSECDKFNDVDVSLDDIVEYSPSQFHDVEIGDYKFVFKQNNSKKFKERVQAANTKVEKEFVALVLSIVEVQQGDEVYDTFTFDELYEFIENLDTETFDVIYNAFVDMNDKLTMNYSIECLFCKVKNTGSLETIPGFLWD